MSSALRQAAVPTLLGFGLVVVSILTRPLLPLDETRLASVAWEMWSHGDYLVPHLNGAAYSHKPPLLFWLVTIAWKLFGVGTAWVRVVPAVFGLACLPGSALLARRLWPDDPAAASIAPWALFGTGLWTTFSTLVSTFDAVLALLTLAGVLGILLAVDGAVGWGWLVTGLAFGLGLLAKGPVIFAHLLPVALLAPWWAGGRARARSGAWLAGLLLAVGCGIALALAWAVPAALAGGASYRGQILWEQTARRVVDSFAHRHPWWFYLAFLPFVLAPWSLWPETWRALARLRTGPADRGVRFCIAWALPALFLLSLVSGKQPYYLLPVLPAFALLLARAISSSRRPAARVSRVPTALLLAATGALVGGAARGALGGLPTWVAEIPAWTGLTLVAGGVGLVVLPRGSLAREVRLLACAPALLLLVVHVGMLRPALAVLDLGPVAEILHQAEAEGRPIANVGAYEGQYHFLGCLTHPIAVVEAADVAAWARQHPRGEIVVYGRGRAPSAGLAPHHVQAARGLSIEVWSSEAILGDGRSLTEPRGGG